MTNATIDINKQILDYFKSGRKITKVQESERTLGEHVWYKETYPINYKLRYKNRRKNYER